MIDLGSIGLIVDRPWATPAPTTPQPTPPPPLPPPLPPASPWQPRVTDLTRLRELVDGTDALIDGCRATVTDLTAAIARSRAARGEVA